MRTCLIFNPLARGGKARHFRRHLDSMTSECVLQTTDCAGAGRRLAARAVLDGFETIVAAGGDGTVNEVLNGMGDIPGGFERARLAILPLGTVNVFARELGLPRNPALAWDVICRGEEIRIDLPVAEFTLDGKPQRRYFVQLGGAGLDSKAIELMDWNLKKKIAALAYIVAGIKAVKEFHPLITVGGDQTAAGELVLFGNGRYYGGNFIFFPKASLTDGMIDLSIFPKVRWRECLKAGLGLLTNRVPQFCGATILQASAVTLTSTKRVLLELDGENVGELPATITVAAKGLRVVR